MQPWARTVVAGRARLGVVAVETRTVELPTPPTQTRGQAHTAGGAAMEFV